MTHVEFLSSKLFICISTLKVFGTVKRFPHWLELYGSSPLWIHICIFRLPDWFSPVWILMCFFRLPDWVDSDPHSSQLYSFSLVQILWRLAGLSLTDRVNSFVILYTNYYNICVGYYCFIGTVKVRNNMFLLVYVVSKHIFWLLTCYN